MTHVSNRALGLLLGSVPSYLSGEPSLCTEQSGPVWENGRIPSKEISTDMDDLTPAGSGSLRGALRPGTREPVATFTATRTVHPDEIWNPRGGEITGPRPWRSGSQADHREPKRAGRMRQHEEVGQTVRTALRPGG
jgi:hypothetical protein